MPMPPVPITACVMISLGGTFGRPAQDVPRHDGEDGGGRAAKELPTGEAMA